MRCPTLTEISQSREMVSVFGGYNHNMRIGENEFFYMQNMSSDDYPMLSTRRRRGAVMQMTTPQGLLAKDAMAYVDSGKLYYNGAEVTGLTLTEGEKQLVSMGAYLLIWPDKKYLNTKNLTDYGSMEATYESSGTVTYSLCTADGGALGKVSSSKPEEPEAGEYWIDTTQTPHSLMVWSASTEMWTGVGTVYTKIQADGIGANFAEYDGVKISGAAYGGDSAVVKEQFDSLNGTKVIYARDDDYIVVVGLIDLTYEQTDGTVTVGRVVPDMDYVCEAQNRIWGCKYGMVDGKAVNELYCCALGDFKNWNRFLGISTDAWAASVGSDGAWTGAANYLGYPTFFKEHVIHRIAISSSGAHQVMETVGRGVQSGSYKSLSVCNEVLYYKSRSGVCAYDGSFPASIGACFGGKLYGSAVGGSFGGKYYLSMKDAGNTWHLFVYDVEKNLWHREDNTHVMQFAAMDDDLYFIDADSKKMMCVMGTQGELEDDLEWCVETGSIGFNYPDKKYLSRWNIRMNLEAGSNLRMDVQYDTAPDSSGLAHWKMQNGGSKVADMKFANTATLTVPVRPRRCDHMRVRLSGKGRVHIFSIAKILELGSDL